MLKEYELDQMKEEVAKKIKEKSGDESQFSDHSVIESVFLNLISKFQQNPNTNENETGQSAQMQTFYKYSSLNSNISQSNIKDLSEQDLKIQRERLDKEISDQGGIKGLLE